MITFERFVNEAGCTIHHSLDFINEYQSVECLPVGNCSNQAGKEPEICYESFGGVNAQVPFN